MKDFIKNIIVAILTWEARMVLLKYQPKVVGITGSVGKTSAKDAIYTSLASSFFVRKSQKSYNSEIGVPLTILGCENAWNNPFLWVKNILIGIAVILFPNHYPKWLVLEIGLDQPGDIERVISWLKFDVVVFTKYAKTPVHVEFFDNNPENVWDEKNKLADALKPNGVLVINQDDPLLKFLRQKSGTHILTYGFGDRSNVRATHEEVMYSEGGRRVPRGINFKVESKGSSVPIQMVGVLGRQHMYPILAGITVGISQSLNVIDMANALKKHENAPGRMRLLAGIRDTMLVDDTYNSSPVAARAALAAMHEAVPNGRRIVVLGDMMELGKLSIEAHRDIGEYVAKTANVLLTVGQRSEYIAEGARESGMNAALVTETKNVEQGIDALSGLLQSGDTVLIKGSQSVRMERMVQRFMRYPEQARELLVRQEDQWQKR